MKRELKYFVLIVWLITFVTSKEQNNNNKNNNKNDKNNKNNNKNKNKDEETNTPTNSPSQMRLPNSFIDHETTIIDSSILFFGPTGVPSILPSPAPSIIPSTSPSHAPSGVPSTPPSTQSSKRPSSGPTQTPSYHHSILPSNASSKLPSLAPSHFPSNFPTRSPSRIPSQKPTRAPSNLPSSFPSKFPSQEPSLIPSSTPSLFPTLHFSQMPTFKPSRHPSISPTSYPSNAPSARPTIDPNKLVFLSASIETYIQYVPTKLSSNHKSIYRNDIQSFLSALFEKTTPPLHNIEVLVGNQILVDDNRKRNRNRQLIDNGRLLQFIKSKNNDEGPFYILQVQILVSGQYVNSTEYSIFEMDMETYVVSFFVKHGDVLRDFIRERRLDYFEKVERIYVQASNLDEMAQSESNNFFTSLAFRIAIICISVCIFLFICILLYVWVKQLSSRKKNTFNAKPIDMHLDGQGKKEDTSSLKRHKQAQPTKWGSSTNLPGKPQYHEVLPVDSATATTTVSDEIPANNLNGEYGTDFSMQPISYDNVLMRSRKPQSKQQNNGALVIRGSEKQTDYHHVRQVDYPYVKKANNNYERHAIYDHERQDNYNQERANNLREKQADYHNERQANYHNERQGDYHNERQPNYHNERQADYHNVRQPNHHNERHPNYHNVRHPNYHNVRQANYHNVRQANYHNERQANYHNVRQADYHNVRQANYHNERQANYHNERQADYHNVRQADYHNERQATYQNERQATYQNERQANYHNERQADYHNERQADYHNERQPDYQYEITQADPEYECQHFYNDNELMMQYDDKSYDNTDDSADLDRLPCVKNGVRIKPISPNNFENEPNIEQRKTTIATPNTQHYRHTKKSNDESSSVTSFWSNGNISTTDSSSISANIQKWTPRDCFAPPGKLGLAVRSSSSGPVVTGLHEDSPLQGQMFPGDFIISIDELDTRGMPAVELTKIAERRKLHARKLTVMSLMNIDNM